LRQDGQLKEADEIKQQLAVLLNQDQADTEIDMKAVKLNNEGAKLQSTGDLRGAAEKYGEAARLSPKNVPIRVNYAIAMLRLGQWSDGLNELHASLLLDPNNTKIRAALRDALAQAPADAAPQWKSEFK
jgi:tetratricopeptide (TPR) repeat protein